MYANKSTAIDIRSKQASTHPSPSINFKVIGNALLGSRVVLMSEAERLGVEKMRRKAAKKRRKLFHSDNPDSLPFKQTLAGKAVSACSSKHSSGCESFEAVNGNLRQGQSDDGNP
jgi:hypothetical protein